MPALSETVDELRSDRIHGGSWMARRAVEALLEVTAEPASSTAELLERLLASPKLLEVGCRSIEQMRMANALCLLVEISEAQAAATAAP